MPGTSRQEGNRDRKGRVLLPLHARVCENRNSGFATLTRMAILKAVRGTRDLLPPETELWNRVEATARAVFARYGFGEIRTPVFEATELFARGVGEETDIVSKEMYTWDDRARAASEKAQSLTLRPETT